VLATEAKLALNNLEALCKVLDALSYLREKTGYGSIELVIQNGLVLRCNTHIQDKVEAST
jgi:hypothetical protein